MSFRCAAVLALLVLGQGRRAVERSTLTFDENSVKNRPVSKVINLLKDMQAQLEKEGEEDQKVYDAMTCWCETNDKAKTKSIADGEAHIVDLQTKIEELTGTSARLNTETEKLDKEIKKNTDALDKATALRKKQLAEFTTEEQDLLSSISSLKGAVTTLSAHNGASLMQIVKTEFKKHEALLKRNLSHELHKIALSLLQQPSTFGDSYAPQSGPIFGLLSQMKETFETNLVNSQKQEDTHQKAFEGLKAATTEEINAGEEQFDAKTQELAATDEANGQAKEDLADTRDTLAADQEFLGMLKEKCALVDEEMAQRQKTRNLEIEAVSKALAVLSGDDAHDLFTKTFNFVQINSATHFARRAKASAVLAAAGAKLNRPQLSALASRMRLDAFSVIKGALDKMEKRLAAEAEAEIKQKDYCVDGLNENQLDTEQKQREKTDTQDKIDDLTEHIKVLTEDIATLKEDIGFLQLQMKRAGEDREKESAEFQMTVQDQRATQKLLNKALTILKGFYDKKVAAASFVQKQEPAGPPPPPGFKSYENNRSSGGVMGMIQQIIDDAKAMEEEAVHAEDETIKAYGAFVEETNNSINAKAKSEIDKSAEKASAEKSLAEANEDMNEKLEELLALANKNQELHHGCDYLLKNFDIRQEARDQELEALKDAEAIMSGATF